MDIKDAVKKFPDSPGVYIMRGVRGQVLYVGKAGSLRKRVSSYFARSGHPVRIDHLVSEIKKIDYIKTNSEAEALIYEAGLIKSVNPKYNIDLKDDKSYPYLKLTSNEEYPRLLIVRGKKADGALYFGPYTNVRLLRQAVAFMRTVFPLRVCKKMGRKLCMNYHIAKCPGPCRKKIDKKTYRKTARDIEMFLDGRRSKLLDKLSRRMEEVSRRLDFEEAVRIRDRIRNLSTIVTKRSVPGPLDQIDELKFILRLKRRPKRIEAFDISNIRGKEAVGSMVSFYDGK
ncbi:MAG: UvrB/UvrC motif-containing protein, partial [Candidatus Omnitrophota bacterium]